MPPVLQDTWRLQEKRWDTSEGGKSSHLLDHGLGGKTAHVFFCYVLARLIPKTLNISHHSELKFIYVFIYLLSDLFVSGERSQYREKWNSKWWHQDGSWSWGSPTESIPLEPKSKSQCVLAYTLFPNVYLCFIFLPCQSNWKDDMVKLKTLFRFNILHQNTYLSILHQKQSIFKKQNILKRMLYF